MPTMVKDGELIVLRAHSNEHFVYLHASENPLTCPGADHFGFQVDTADALDAIVDRARKFAESDVRVGVAGTCPVRSSTSAGCAGIGPKRQWWIGSDRSMLDWAGGDRTSMPSANAEVAHFAWVASAPRAPRAPCLSEPGAPGGTSEGLGLAS